MASSRWKRFAFFDRKNLPLPPSIVKDLIPPSLSSGRLVDDNAPSATLYPEESTGENARIGIGEYFSLSHCTAALPHDLSVDNDDDEEGGGGAAVRRHTMGEGVSAMLAGRMARLSVRDDVQSHDHVVADSHHGGSKSGDGSNSDSLDNDALQLLYISSRNTCQIHCIDITSRCTPSNPRKQQRGATNTASITAATVTNRDAFRENDNGQTNNDNDYNAEELDGWRGYYNPFRDGLVSLATTVNTSNNNNNSSSKSVSSRQNVKRSAAEQRILDEHLSTTSGTNNNTDNSAQQSSSSLFASSPFAQEVKHARIIGVATCSCTSFSNNINSNDHYVASITDERGTTGIIVHVNPHLRLETSLPPQTAMIPSGGNVSNNTAASQYIICYRPSSEFKFKHVGNPRCVSVQPGVVCVGTDTGVVLIYVFDCHHHYNNDHGNNDNNNNSGTGAVGGHGKMALVAEIPAPRGVGGNNNSQGSNESLYCVSSVELIPPPESEVNARDNANQQNQQQQASYNNGSMHRLFVSYRRRNIDPTLTDNKTNNPSERNNTATTSSSTPTGGVCCYELGGLRIPGAHLNTNSNLQSTSVVSARYDMDGRDVPSSNLCSILSPPSLVFNNQDVKSTPQYTVARSDGLHFYSRSEKAGVCPVDGDKIAMCHLPPVSPVAYLKRRRLRRVLDNNEEQKNVDGGGENVMLSSGGGCSGRNDSTTAGASYVLVATTDAKAHRDAVDIYDTSNKLVGFHVLLSPGHRALRTVGLMASPVVRNGVLVRGGRASAVVFTSGGSIVTLTEKVTPDQVALLVQKQLYPAAISMAFSDPAFYSPDDITGLYRKYAEYLYRKGEFSAAMDQYILTIGSLESSHVIFRYLDAPKIPLVVKYLEALRAKGLASSVHDEMLRTCYLKLGDHESARGILSPSAAGDGGMSALPLNPDGSEIPTVSISRNLLACADDPSEMLAAICSLEAPEAAEALVEHGPLLARSLARETAGVVIALCDGSYSPTALADAAAGRTVRSFDEKGNALVCEKYPICLFANAFIENPRLFRLILSHCRRNDCVLSPMLRRTLLELTLDEWNTVKRTGDAEVEKLRRDEALTMLSDNQADDMGDYEALVIVQAAGFLDGEILLYERLNMTHMLLEHYARSGNERARRNMLSMCEHDPDLFAEVLSHFVSMTAERINKDGLQDGVSVSSDTEIGALLRDIHEALVLARDHGNSIPPVRVLRILAGEGFGKFSSTDQHSHNSSCCGNIPLSVAMDYVGATLDESITKMQRLQNNVEEYSRLCSEMEIEIDALLSSSLTREDKGHQRTILPNLDIDEMYSNLCKLANDSEAFTTATDAQSANNSIEAFWREMEHSHDPLDTVCYFLSRGHLDGI